MGLEPPKPEASAPPTAPGVSAPPDAATAAGSEFAKKADDLEEIKQAVDDAASVGGGLWLSYLFVLFYLAIAAGAVTHADLFLENPVKLPFLNVELPLLAFFFLAPILFLFVHAYTLVHLVFLTDKAKRFDQALSQQIGDDSGAAKDANDPRVAAIAGVRGQLPSNIFIQFLAGPRDRRAGSFGWLLRVIAWSTLAIAPILLLLLFQLQFLPFHLSWVTWTHRLALVADLALVWWLWRKILSGRDSVTPRPRAAWAWRGVGVLLTVCAVLFSLGLATFPGEWQTEALAAWRPIHQRDQLLRPMVSIHDWLFESRIDNTTRRRRWPLSSTLVLTGFNIYEGLNIDDPDKVKGRDFVFLARGRDLRGAIFDLAVLPKIDFTRAELDGASLDGAQLQSAQLFGAQLQGASLEFARLQGARLFGARLEGASLNRAQLQGASLYCVFALDGGRLCPQLQGASLAGAQLQGASLAGAELQGASLQEAILEATDLSGAWLWRTNAKALAKPAAVQLPNASWEPSWRDATDQIRTWDDKTYRDLRRTIEALPAGDQRVEALETISGLDCASPDKMLASCDPQWAWVPPLTPPPEAVAWRQTLEAAAVDAGVYAVALAKTLKGLVCSGDDDAVHVVGGWGFQSRLHAAGPAAADLIEELMDKDGKDCLVAGSLTDANRARLLQTKRAIEAAKEEQRSAPSDAPHTP